MSTLPTTGRIATDGFLALAIAMGIGRFAFTPLLPMMENEGLLDLQGAGWLASIHFLGYAMGALLAIRYRLPPRAALPASLAAISLSTMAMGLSENLTVWLTARWIAGFCSAIVLILIGTHSLGRLSEAGKGNLQGLVFAGVGIGIALAGLITLGLMTETATARTGWLLFGAIALLAGLGLVVPETGRPQPGPGAAPRRTPLSPSLLLPYGMMGAGYIIPATFLPAMAAAEIADPVVFGWGWPAFGLAAAASTALTSRLARRYHDRQIWVAAQLIMAAGLLLPVLMDGIGPIILGGIAVGGTFMVITMAGLKEAHRMAGPDDAGRHIAAMTASFAAGQMIAPAFAGWLQDATGGFGTPLVLASLLLTVTVLPLALHSGTAGAGRTDPGTRSGELAAALKMRQYRCPSFHGRTGG